MALRFALLPPGFWLPCALWPLFALSRILFTSHLLLVVFGSVPAVLGLTKPIAPCRYFAASDGPVQSDGRSVSECEKTDFRPSLNLRNRLISRPVDAMKRPQRCGPIATRVQRRRLTAPLSTTHSTHALSLPSFPQGDLMLSRRTPRRGHPVRAISGPQSPAAAALFAAGPAVL